MTIPIHTAPVHNIDQWFVQISFKDLQGGQLSFRRMQLGNGNARHFHKGRTLQTIQYKFRSRIRCGSVCQKVNLNRLRRQKWCLLLLLLLGME